MNLTPYLGWLGLLAGLLVGLALLYWELILCEGAHLGPGVVGGLYDLVAPRYDVHIKKFDPGVEDDFLGLPLVATLIETEAEAPRVLDVGAGTGRVARALLRQTAFAGAVINLERAPQMLRHGQAATDLWPGRARWLRGAAGRLPFPDNTFDLVTCLEVLEFLPDARAALAECVRVLKPGGWLVITNRVGWIAPLILGKTFSRPAFRQLLESLPMASVQVCPWQVEYDLGWGKKSAETDAPRAPTPTGPSAALPAPH